MEGGPKETTWQSLYDTYHSPLRQYLINLKDHDKYYYDVLNIINALEILAQNKSDPILLYQRTESQPPPGVQIGLPHMEATKYLKQCCNENFIREVKSKTDLDNTQLIKCLTAIDTKITLEEDLAEKEDLKKAAAQRAKKATENLVLEVGLGAIVLTGLSMTMFWVGGFALIPSLLIGLAAGVPVAYGAKIYDDAQWTPTERYQNEVIQVNKQLDELEDTLSSEEQQGFHQCKDTSNKVSKLGHTLKDKQKIKLDNMKYTLYAYTKLHNEHKHESEPDKIKLQKEMATINENIRTGKIPLSYSKK